MRRSPAAVLALVGAVLLLAGCATPAPRAAPAPASAEPTAQPAALVSAGHLTTVIDDGTGAEICLGMVAASLPPQCGGPTLTGWDWDDWPGSFEESGGVRFGDYLVTGAFDPEANTLTPTEVIPAAQYQEPSLSENPDFASACPEPAGGWTVPEPDRVTAETMNAAFERAATLPGYSGAWLDQSPNPLAASPRPDTDEGMNDPLLTVVNVAVTGDLAAAEAALREVWGGMLCVSRGARTEAEMLELQDELSKTPGMLMTGSDAPAGTVDLQVVYDDGTLQARLDAEHGPGVVEVSSVLQPAE